MIKLFLDDTRPAPEDWVRVYTAQQAIDYLKTGEVQQLSLDHDLGPEDIAGTGYQVLEWIEREVHLHAFKRQHTDGEPGVVHIRITLAILIIAMLPIAVVAVQPEMRHTKFCLGR